MKLDVLSVNYDFIPSEIESPKQLWIELRNPVPRDLYIGNTVYLNRKKFIVRDIIGNKIVLDYCLNEPRCSFARWGWGCSGTNISQMKHFQNCNHSSGCGINFSIPPQTKGCNSPKSSTLYDVSLKCPMTTTNVLEYQPVPYKICLDKNYEQCKC